jgi:hypothetical protein
LQAVLCPLFQCSAWHSLLQYRQISGSCMFVAKRSETVWPTAFVYRGLLSSKLSLLTILFQKWRWASKIHLPGWYQWCAPQMGAQLSSLIRMM